AGRQQRQPGPDPAAGAGDLRQPGGEVMRAIAASLMLLAGVAQAAPSRAEVERLLSGYEPRADAAAFRRLGPGVDHVLVAIASDGAASRLRRQRAMAALAWVPSVEGRDLLRAVVREKARAVEGADALDLYTCARALGAFGPEVAVE